MTPEFQPTAAELALIESFRLSLGGITPEETAKLIRAHVESEMQKFFAQQKSPDPHELTFDDLWRDPRYGMDSDFMNALRVHMSKPDL